MNDDTDEYDGGLELGGHAEEGFDQLLRLPHPLGGQSGGGDVEEGRRGLPGHRLGLNDWFALKITYYNWRIHGI